MTERCASPIHLEELIAYHVGELSQQAESAVEDHYMACAECTARLESVVELGDAIGAVIRRGLISATVTAQLIDKGAAGGLRIRNYHVGAGERVACTAAPTDDFVAIRLGLDAAGAREVDVDVQWTALDTGASEQRFIGDVAYDRDAGEIVMLFAGDQVREFPRSRWVMDVVLHESAGERRVGPYTLEHTPWAQLAPADR